MGRRLKITLGPVGGPGCKIVDAETGQIVPNVRKVTVVCEIGKPTTATVELVDVEVQAEAGELVRVAETLG